jgi:ubiquinone biosynthesis accessory factor UbiK
MFDFAKQNMQDFLNELRNGLQGKRPEDLSQSQLRSLLESVVRKLQLVTREEFDAQQAVLLRTRLKLEELEKEVVALQERMGGPKDPNHPV